MVVTTTAYLARRQTVFDVMPLPVNWIGLTLSSSPVTLNTRFEVVPASFGYIPQL